MTKLDTPSEAVLRASCAYMDENAENDGVVTNRVNLLLLNS